MNKEEILAILQSCLLCLDGGIYEDYPQLNRELWIMGEKLFNYLNKLEAKIET